ncbi:MAG: protein-glutamate O-methyltransferase CheR [Clostridia bacterium]|nr:protein-glutamate O-methyltransferase CheR [Clostridia bacterium]
MSHSLSSKEFSLMQKFIQEKCGIAIGEEKAYLIECRLSKLLIDSNLSSFEELYERITSRSDPNITEQVIDAITTNETLWFRDRTPWEILEDILLPRYIEEMRTGKRSVVKIWSAACSTGQEPYSTAMCIDNYLKRNGITDISLSRFKITATDISRSVVQIAKLGRYDSISIMRGLEEYYKSRYFTNEGRVWTLDDKIKNAVHFQQFNLQNSFLLLGKFDVVFCRYVIIYFSSDLKMEIIKKIAAAAEPDGVLFLGSSEIFPGQENSFETLHHKNGVYYKVKG